MAGMGAPGIGTINNWAAGIGTGLFGYHQYREGKNLSKGNNRPTYEIPPEIAQNLTQAQQQALQGLPEEQKQQYISNLQRSSAYALSQTGSRRGGLAGVAAINQNQNDAYGNMLAQDSAARMQNQQQVYGQRQNMADYKDQAWKVNQFDPYGLTLAKSEALMGAGIQNMGNSFQIAGGKSGNAENPYKAPQQTNLTAGTNYLSNDNSYMRGMQVGQNQNNYYNPNSPYSQSGTMIPDNFDTNRATG